jgi:AcrR family transcriptional regulator
VPALGQPVDGVPRTTDVAAGATDAVRAGARVSDIADRAGVNKQLISYHFSGKEGLYTELSAQWRQTSATLPKPRPAVGEPPA